MIVVLIYCFLYIDMDTGDIYFVKNGDTLKGEKYLKVLNVVKNITKYMFLIRTKNISSGIQI
jgi:hypothetical protein